MYSSFAETLNLNRGVKVFEKYNKLSLIQHCNTDTHARLGVGEAVRVGHNKEEDIHLVEDAFKSAVTSMSSYNLLTEM